MANIELDGPNKKIKVDSGDLTLDIPGDIILDADGGDITFADGGTNLLKITNSSSDVVFQPQVDTKDIVFKQYDGTVVATVEDNATFNVPTGKLAINGTAITSTAAELNILDGVTSTASEINLLDGGTSVGSSITLADADGVIVNDNGTMKTIPASDFKTYAGGDNKPFFLAYASGNFTVGNATFVDMPCNTDSSTGFDSDSAFNTTNYKFTPQTAGYYWFAAGARTTSQSAWEYQSMRIRKNGTEFAVGINNNNAGDGTLSCNASGSIYLNGSSDYVTASIYQSSGGNVDYYGGLGSNYFTGFKLIGT